MKYLASVLAVLVVLAAGIAQAERPAPSGGAGLGRDGAISTGDLKVTPEMWFYDQGLRQYNNPKMAVRAMAETRAMQRMRRIESMRWYGFSNARPRVSSDPYSGDYSAAWTANPANYPLRWSGVGMTIYGNQ